MPTPIKIPGKTSANCSKAILAKRKATGRKARPIGRPFKSASSSASSSRSSTPQLSSKRLKILHSTKTRDFRISNLEKLPTEILQRVFLYCLNFDLPSASPIIGGKLSSQHIYLQSVFHAFEPSWTERLGMLESYYRTGKRPKPSAITEGDPKLQTRLLRCRWASLGLLRTAEKKWVAQCFLRSTIKEEGRTGALGMYSEKVLSWEDLLLDTKLETDLVQFEESTIVPDLLLEPGRRAQLERILFPQGSSTGFGLERFHKDTQLPESLLRGPKWTKEMQLHLLHLIRGGAKIDWFESTSGEVAQEGHKWALKHGDTAMQFTLEYLGA